MKEKVKNKRRDRTEYPYESLRYQRTKKERGRVITGEAKESVEIGVAMAVLSSFSNDVITFVTRALPKLSLF